MVRPRRIEFPGAIYHITARGNRKLPIFHDIQDYKKYLSLLEKYHRKFHFIIYAFALIPNHIHLLIQTPFAPISQIMQGIQETYTMYYNLKYKTIGHVFQGRFKHKLCHNVKYFIQLIKYIHTNSIDAGLVVNIDEYPWCSHIAYIGEIQKFEFMDVNNLAAFLDANDRKDFLKIYNDLIHDALTLDPETKKALLDPSIFEEKFTDNKFFDVSKLQDLQTKFSCFKKTNISRTKLFHNLNKNFKTTSGTFLSNNRNKNILTIKCMTNYYLIHKLGFSITKTARLWNYAMTTVIYQTKIAGPLIKKNKKMYELIGEIIEKSIG